MNPRTLDDPFKDHAGVGVLTAGERVVSDVPPTDKGAQNVVRHAIGVSLVTMTERTRLLVAGAKHHARTPETNSTL